MTFDIEINGRRRSVRIEPMTGGDRFRVTIDGTAHEIAATKTDLGWTIAYGADGRIVDAAVTQRPRQEWLVQLPAATIIAVVGGRPSRRTAAGDVPADGEQRIVAPMPGRVVRVLVKPGEDVTAGQGIVVVEAMKMENELGSPKAGRVRDIAVAEGASVEAGRLLAVIE